MTELSHGNMELKQGDYVGEISGTVPHGNGILNYKNGDRYNGRFLSGKPSGRGKMVYSNGNIYEGYWYEGLPQNNGRIRYANKDVYEGEWKKGKKYGHGKYLNIYFQFNFSSNSRYLSLDFSQRLKVEGMFKKIIRGKVH